MLATKGIDDHHHPTQEVYPSDHKALLTPGVGIFTSERLFILKDAHRIGEIDAVSAEVGSRFVRVPLIHSLIVHTLVHIIQVFISWQGI